MKVYLSGPMTGLPEYNYPAFFEAEAQLVALGYEVCNPARLPDPETPTWENFMRLAIPRLCGCDLVCQLPGWERSRGALVEMFVSEVLGIERKALAWVISAETRVLEALANG